VDWRIVGQKKQLVKKRIYYKFADFAREDGKMFAPEFYGQGELVFH